MQKKSNNSTISTAGRIRRYVVSLLSKAKSDDIMIPSLKELADQFNVSRQTASYALKELTAEGYLIARPGLGTFINPHKLQPWGQEEKRIGVLVGDGMLMYYDHYFGMIMAEIFKALLTGPYRIQLPQLSSGDPKTIIYELKLENFDGLIWINPPKKIQPYLEEMQKNGKPFVTYGAPNSSVVFDRQALGRMIGERMLKENRNHTLCLFDQEPLNAELKGVREAFQKAGVEFNNRLCRKETKDIESYLTAIFERGAQLDCILNLFYPYAKLEEKLLKYGVDCNKNCLFVQNELNVHQEPKIPGIYYDYDISALAAEIRKHLDSCIQNGKALPQSVLPLKIRTIN